MFDSKRKVTLYSVPTFSVKEQMVIECRSCTQRFAVPADMRETFLGNILTEAEVAARMRNVGLARVDGPGERTFYQTLQVDPAADRRAEIRTQLGGSNPCDPLLRLLVHRLLGPE